MRNVRFIEDLGGPGDTRRLLFGIADSEDPPEADGGRREAVRLATMADLASYPVEYARYYRSFPVPEGAERTPVPGVEVPPAAAAAVAEQDNQAQQQPADRPAEQTAGEQRGGGAEHGA